MMLPDTILSGYPEREYRITGEWSEQQARGGRNVAYRNRRMVWYPIYRADDGSIICPAWLAQKERPRSYVE